MPKKDDVPPYEAELGWWSRQDLKGKAETFGRNKALELIVAIEKEFGPDGEKPEYKEKVDQFVRSCLRKKETY